jgi:hypothetical protein
MSGSRMNCCSPTQNVKLILQLSVDELEGSGCGAQSEDLRMLCGRHIIWVQYLRGCQTWIDSASAMTASFRTDSEDSVLSSDSKIEKKKEYRQ